MTAYLIVNHNVIDAERLGAYAAAAAGPLGVGTDSKVLVADEATEALEGTTPGTRTIVLEFESKEKARELINSPEYQAIAGERLESTSDHFTILVDGL